MITVAFFDTSESLEENLLSMLCDEDEKNLIFKIKAPEIRKRRIASRALLNKLFSDIYEEKVPKIRYTGVGMPYFEGERVKFSISYASDIVALALSDEGGIGIDLEDVSFKERLERVNERFKEAIAPISCKKDENVSFDLNLLFFEKDLKSSAPFDFHKEKNAYEKARRFTSLESVLKLFGAGFSGIKKTEEYAEKVQIETLFFSHGAQHYTFSLAVEKRK